MTSGQFKPVAQLILELTPLQQQQLYNDIYAIIRNLDWSNVGQLTALVMGSEGIQQKLLAVMESCLAKEFGAQMQSQQ